MRARHPRKRKTTPTRQGASLAHRSHASNSRVVAIALFLLMIVWVAFGRTLGHEFVDYDDGDYVYENPNITQGLSLRGVVWAFTHVHAANWHPLTTLSHMLDCQLYGLQPWGHHLTNVLLQAAAAILLFLALRRLTGSSLAERFCGGRVCHSSLAGGIGRLDLGTKGCAQRRLFHAHSFGLRALCPQRAAFSRPIPDCGRPLCPRFDVQTDPGHAPLCPIAPGLLAFGQMAEIRGQRTEDREQRAKQSRLVHRRSFSISALRRFSFRKNGR